MMITSQSKLQEALRSSGHKQPIIDLMKKCKKEFGGGTEKIYFESFNQFVRRFLEGNTAPYKTTPRQMHAKIETMRRLREIVPKGIEELEDRVQSLLRGLGYREERYIMTMQEHAAAGNKVKDTVALIESNKATFSNYIPLGVLLTKNNLHNTADARQLNVGIYLPVALFLNIPSLLHPNGPSAVLASLEPLAGKGSSTESDPKFIDTDSFDHLWFNNRPLEYAIKHSKIRGAEVSPDFPFRRAKKD